MNQKISGPVAAVIIVVAAVLIIIFGYRKVTGGKDADVTQEAIAHWRGMAAQEHKASAAGGMQGAPAGAPQNLSH